jgi:hypothetical protein
MTAFVLGNGQSRETISIEKLEKLGQVYGCNALYRTHTPWVLVAADQKIATAIQESGYALENRFYTRRPAPHLGALPIPKPYHGYSSGPIATALAAQDGHRRIYLLGFDMAADAHGRFNNIYADTEFYKPRGAEPTYTGNWQRQLLQIFQDFADREFIRVLSKTTAVIPEFDARENYHMLDIASFVQRINTSKDL